MAIEKIGIVTDTTYSELMTKINSSELEPGIWYRFEFQTKHYPVSFDSDSWQLTPINDPVIGEAEHLLVLATSRNTISVEAYSEEYPEDVLKYNPFPDEYLDCPNFAIDGTIIPGWKGVITFRHDTVLNNRSNHDFRNVKNRMWSIAQQEWTQRLQT